MTERTRSDERVISKHYDRIARRIREAPHGPLNLAYRHWIVRYHLRYGRMPPLDLRPDWPHTPDWSSVDGLASDGTPL